MLQPWKITYGNWEWTDETATVLHLVAVAELTDNSWAACSPWTGPRQLAAWLAVLLSTELGDLDTATRRVYALSVAELAECLAERDAPSTLTD